MKYYALLLVTASCLLAMPRPAAAEMSEFGTRLKNCRDITSMLNRVKCYDQTVDDHNLETLGQNDIATAVGKWKTRTEKSPITDGQNIYLSLSGNDYVTTPDGRFIRPSIVLRCADGKTEGYTVWETTLGTENITVNMRIGADEVVADKWALSADKQGAFIPDPQRFSMKLMDQKNVFIKVWPNQNSSLQSSFDVRGLSEAIKPLKAACDWKDLPPLPAAVTPAPVTR